MSPDATTEGSSHTALQSAESGTAPQSAHWCWFYGGGIVGMLLIYGLLQERIMAVPYGTDFFSVSIFLVFWNRIVAIISALFMIFVQREDLRNAAPLWKYLAISLPNVAASYCQYEALRYIYFPALMLFKMVLVMLLVIAITRRSDQFTRRSDWFTRRSDWFVAPAVIGGVTLFLVSRDIFSKHKHGIIEHGLILLLFLLALHGFTRRFQEKLFGGHEAWNYNQMLYVNIFAGLVSFIAWAAQRKIGVAFGFFGMHPRLILDALILSASAVGGQCFIHSQLKEFGVLVYAATMNLRQVISILVSCIVYKHHISGVQVIGLLLVFLGLFYKSYVGLVQDSKEESNKGESEETKPLLNKDLENSSPQPDKVKKDKWSMLSIGRWCN